MSKKVDISITLPESKLKQVEELFIPVPSDGGKSNVRLNLETITPTDGDDEAQIEAWGVLHLPFFIQRITTVEGREKGLFALHIVADDFLTKGVLKDLSFLLDCSLEYLAVDLQEASLKHCQVELKVNRKNQKKFVAVLDSKDLVYTRDEACLYFYNMDFESYSAAKV